MRVVSHWSHEGCSVHKIGPVYGHEAQILIRRFSAASPLHPQAAALQKPAGLFADRLRPWQVLTAKQTGG
jgi:hypothetical protein